MDKDISCAIGLTMGGPVREYKHVDEVALNKEIPSLGGKAAYAQAASRVDSKAGKNLIQRTRDRAFTFLDEIGIPAHDIYLAVADPASVLGDDVVRTIESIYQDHISINGLEAPNVWHSTHGKQIEGLKSQALNSVEPIYRDYATKYFDMHIGGGQLYNMPKEGALAELATNAVGNLVAWNPMITTMNAFEFSPKALAYATEIAGPQGAAAVTRAMARFASQTGGKFWKRIPELEGLGVYGVRERNNATTPIGKAQEFLSKHDLLQVTENPLRALSYFTGEELRAMGFNTSGSEALEKIAFVNRFGNEPMIFLDHQQKSVLTLMRYSVSSAKFYTRLIAKAAQGDPKAIGAFVVFSGITALQTGSSSAIPTPVNMVLEKFDPETQEALAEFDNATGLNLTAHILGTDLSDQARPLGGLALGVGQTIATTEGKAAYQSIGKTAEALGQGEYDEAAIRATQAVVNAAQLARIPGVNLTTKRAVDVLADVITDEISLDEAPLEMLEKTKLYKEPEL